MRMSGFAMQLTGKYRAMLVVWVRFPFLRNREDETKDAPLVGNTFGNEGPKPVTQLS
jgi:hypothetical protein